MADLNDSFDTLMDSGMWEDAAVAVAAFFAPTVLNNVADDYVPMDVPDEAYGLAVIAGAEFLPRQYRNPARIGAGVYALDQAAERVGIKSTVVSVGA